MKRFYKMIAVLIALCMMLSIGTMNAMAETASPIYSADDLFSNRDLKQTADLSEATAFTVADGQDIHITAAGVYVLTGTASNVTVYVEAGKDDKVQLVLDNLNVTNSSFPVIYGKTADKLFVTTSGDSTMAVTGTFATDDGNKINGVIFSKTDLVLNGTASLAIASTENGIVGKDDLKITGGVYTVTAKTKAIDANDSIRIADGTLNLTAGTDGLHAENNDDAQKGYIYIGGGSITIYAGDDGVHATSVVQIDGGTLSIQATDDGINAGRKSSAYTPTVEINDGDISVPMGAGDTDGIDSNGNIIVNGGTIRVNGSSTFDYDGSAQYNGGVIIANGQQVASIPNQMVGGRGGFGGGWGNGNGGNRGNGGWGRGGW